MKTIEAITKSIKSGTSVRIQTNDTALAILTAVETVAEIENEQRIDDTKNGSDLSALKIVGNKDGKKFTLIAAGARF